MPSIRPKNRAIGNKTSLAIRMAPSKDGIGLHLTMDSTMAKIPPPIRSSSAAATTNAEIIIMRFIKTSRLVNRYHPLVMMPATNKRLAIRRPTYSLFLVFTPVTPPRCRTALFPRTCLISVLSISQSEARIYIKSLEKLSRRHSLFPCPLNL